MVQSAVGVGYVESGLLLLGISSLMARLCCLLPVGPEESLTSLSTATRG